MCGTSYNYTRELIPFRPLHDLAVMFGMITQTDVRRLDLRRTLYDLLRVWQSDYLDTRSARLVFAAFLFVLS